MTTRLPTACPTVAPRRPALTAALATTLAAALLTACDDSGTTPAGSPVPLALAFAAKAGADAIGCDNNATTMGAAADRTLKIKDFRFYVSQVRLIDRDGNRVPVTLDNNGWQRQEGADSVALLDFTSRGDSCSGSAEEMHTVITGTVPAGHYTGVVFELGVPGVLNHTSVATAAAPLDNLAMSWSWQSGRKFVKLESQYATTDAGTGVTTTFNQTFHLGSTGCTGGDAANPASVTCSSPYRPTVTLTGFDPATGLIVADYRALLAETDLAAGFACMPGTTAQCQGIAARIGSDSTGASNGTQSFFRVE